LSRRASPRAGSSGAASHSVVRSAVRVFQAWRPLVDGFGRDWHRDGSAVFVVEPRRQLPGEFVEGAVFHLGQGRGFRIAHRPKRKDVLGRIHGGFQIGLWRCLRSIRLKSIRLGRFRRIGRCNIRLRRQLRGKRISNICLNDVGRFWLDDDGRRRLGCRRMADEFVVAQRGEPRHAVEIAANPEAR